MTSPTPRVVVTGVGVLAPPGIGAADFWAGLVAGQPPEQWLVSPFDPVEMLGYRAARRMDRFAQLASVAADEAMAQAAFGEDLEPSRCGVIFGTCGGAKTLCDQSRLYDENGMSAVSPLTVPMYMQNAASAGFAIKYGWTGLNETVITACASGTHAIVNAWKAIVSGDLDVAAAGGMDAPVFGVIRAAFMRSSALSPTDRSRPFAEGRDGFVLGEGGAVLILESEHHAQARGATPLAYVLGGALTCDAFHISAPRPNGEVSAQCMTTAIRHAGISTDDISWVNAHGTGTPLNDAAEITAIQRVFNRPVPVTSIKGGTGHSIAGAGAIEAAATVLSFAAGVIPPTVTERIDPDLGDLDVVTEPRPYAPGPVLSNSFGFGGHNACIVIAPEPT